MNTVVKHVGFTNTGSKVAVVLPFIPGREDHALIVESDALPPKYIDAFRDLLNTEAQTSNEGLDNLLSRRRFPNGSTMLGELHNNGYLIAVPLRNVTMQVTRTQVMPLADIVSAMRGNSQNQQPEPINTLLTPTIPTLNDGPNISNLAPADEAKNYLVQADMLEHDVKLLREKAYALNPAAAPKKRGRKPKVA